MRLRLISKSNLKTVRARHSAWQTQALPLRYEFTSPNQRITIRPAADHRRIQSPQALIHIPMSRVSLLKTIGMWCCRIRPLKHSKTAGGKSRIRFCNRCGKNQTRADFRPAKKPERNLASKKTLDHFEVVRIHPRQPIRNHWLSGYYASKLFTLKACRFYTCHLPATIAQCTEAYLPIS